MKKYISFFRLRFSLGLQYRAAALAGAVTQFFWGAMQIMIYYAFYQSGANAFPMTFQAVVSYIWIQQAFLAFFMIWFMEHEIFNSIVNGNIAYELCRPINIYHMWFSRSIANRFSKAVLRCFPILIIAILLPNPYRLILPDSFSAFFWFIIAMILGLLVTVAFGVFIYVLTFYTISPQGLRILVIAIGEFFTGAVIPFPFFPDTLRKIMELLPFAAMQNVPLRIYSGDIAGKEIQTSILLQLFWLFLLVVIGKVLCKIAEKRIIIQGG